MIEVGPLRQLYRELLAHENGTAQLSGATRRTALASVANTIDVIENLGLAKGEDDPASWQDLVRHYRGLVEYGHPTPPPLETAAFAVEETSETMDEVFETFLWTVLSMKGASRALKETIRMLWVGDRTNPRPPEETLTRLSAEIAQAIWMLLTLANIFNLDIDAALRAWGEKLVTRTAERYGPPPPSEG